MQWHKRCKFLFAEKLFAKYWIMKKGRYFIKG